MIKKKDLTGGGGRYRIEDRDEEERVMVLARPEHP
jgi:hypothetical protein